MSCQKGCCGTSACPQPTQPTVAAAAGAGQVTACENAGDLTTLLESAGDRFVLIDVFTTWCGPCKQIAPRVVAMSSEFTDVVFGKLDMDQNKAFAQQYQITSIPTFVFFRHKTMVHKFSGADEGQIRGILATLRNNAYDVIPNKTEVNLVGLAKAAQHNGRHGVITSFNPVKGRYTIDLDATDTLAKQDLALKATNLLQAVQVEILAAEGAEAGAAAGVGKVVGVAEGGGSYAVAVDGAEAGAATSAVLPENVVLPVGTVGHVTGLKAEHYNGRLGKVVTYDVDTGRYLFQIETQKQLKLKRQNVLAGPL